MSGHRLLIDIKSFAYQRTKLSQLRGIAMELKGGKPHSLLGPSGCGKSTLLKSLLPEPEGEFDGSIVYFSSGVSQTPEQICRRGRLGLMSQSPGLLPWRTIRQNLRVPARLCRDFISIPKFEECEEALEHVSLKESVLDKYPHELSFGMRQRIAFARAMISSPQFLLLDEVFTGLDIATAQVIERLLCDYTTRTGAVALIVTHNIDIALRSSNGILYMNRKGVVEQLSPTTTASDIVNRFKSDLTDSNNEI